MEDYYRNYFPFNTFFQWLNHIDSDGNDFSHREFAFTVHNPLKQDDYYMRHRSFSDINQFKRKVSGLDPKRFEIGAVYKEPPSDLRNYGDPLSKELVFDIDLSDYDSFRTCCQKHKCCLKCWKFANIAIEVLNKALTEDFGFKHILWVFSGRRGVHAWVCDKRARELDDQQRSDIVDYLLLVNPLATPRPLHPHISRSLEICSGYFDSFLKEQNLYELVDKRTELAKKFEKVNIEIANTLKQKWQASSSNSFEIWQEIDQVAYEFRKNAKNIMQNVKEVKQNIILEILYPKLDVNVSRTRMHLLKSPFCIHPETGKVCVPIDFNTYKLFDPNNVPTLKILLNTDKSENDLTPYINLFKRFVRDLNNNIVKGVNKKIERVKTDNTAQLN